MKVFGRCCRKLLYLGLASMVFPEHLEQECINKGIAVIKQVGDNVVINDENLRFF